MGQPEKVETKEVAVKVEDTEMKDAEKSDGTVMKETSDDTVMKDAEKINGGEKSEDAAITKDAEKSVDDNAKDAEKFTDDNAEKTDPATEKGNTEEKTSQE